MPTRKTSRLKLREKNRNLFKFTDDNKFSMICCMTEKFLIPWFRMNSVVLKKTISKMGKYPDYSHYSKEDIEDENGQYAKASKAWSDCFDEEMTVSESLRERIIVWFEGHEGILLGNCRKENTDSYKDGYCRVGDKEIDRLKKVKNPVYHVFLDLEYFSDRWCAQKVGRMARQVQYLKDSM